MHLRIGRPSASMVVAFTALFLVLGGTGFAATTFNDNKQDTKLVKQLAKKLSVKHAKTADSANTANFANFASAATNAFNATNATNATNAANATNATDLGGQPASAYEPSSKIVTGGGETFMSMGQTGVVIAKIGHYTFTASCTNVGGQPQAEFDVTANTVADLDGNGPQPAGFVADIHQNSDALDGLAPGAFDQVGSASDSTEIAADGQEVDVFYNDGVNWPSVGGTPAHDCFAGVTGFEG
jgi:hypothetical protein